MATSNTCPVGPLTNLSGSIFDTQKVNQAIVQYALAPDGLFFKSSGSVVLTPADVEVRLDPNGEYTLLWSPVGPNPFRANAGQSVHLELTWLVDGGNTVNPWIHEASVQKGGKAWAEQKVLATPLMVAEQSFRADVPSTAGVHDVRDAGGRYQTTGGKVWMRTTIHLENGAQMKSLGTHVNP